MTVACEGLILSVGKSWEPIVYTLKELKPKLVAFLCTPDSCETLDRVLPEYPLKPSQYKILQTPDNPQAIGQMVREFYSAYQWLREEKKLDPLRILVDPTPGRKWMSSAVTMIASYLGVGMAYVDVTFKDGKPDALTMKIVELGNAYDQTGLWEIERGIHYFNDGAWENARETFQKIQSHDSSLNDFAVALGKLSELMKRWDLFAHYKEDLGPAFDEILQSLRRVSFSLQSSQSLIHTLLAEVERLKTNAWRFRGEPPPHLLLTVDLFLNAERCIQRGRFDDGVARLYRALESLAQYYLKKDYALETSNPDYSKMDPAVVEKFRQHKGGKLPSKLGLEDGYVFLHLAKHPILGEEVIRGFKGGKPTNVFHKLLVGRNNSILAHGFDPVESGLAKDLFTKIEGLLQRVLKEKYQEIKKGLVLPKIPAIFVK
jgi:CRISPR-associated protein (TIGR02710 family)